MWTEILIMYKNYFLLSQKMHTVKLKIFVSIFFLNFFQIRLLEYSTVPCHCLIVY